MVDGIAFEMARIAPGLQRTLVASRTKNFFRIRSSKSVPSNRLPAFDAFEQKRIFGFLCKEKMSAHGREQVCCECLVNGHEISLLCQFTKCGEVRLNHELARRVFLPSVPRASRTALRMVAAGARSPVQISHCARPWARNISTPDTVSMPRREASCRSLVLTGR